MLQLFEFMDATFFSMSRFNNFLLIGATDRSKISSDQKRLFIALSLYPLSFFANTPFKIKSMLHYYIKFNHVKVMIVETEENIKHKT